MVHFPTPVIVAAVALNIVPAVAAPIIFEGDHQTREVDAFEARRLHDVSESFKTRDFELETRGPVISKGAQKVSTELAKGYAQTTATNAAQGAINDRIDQRQPLTPQQRAALQQMTGPHDPAIVAAATKGSTASGGQKKKKRNLDDLSERSFDDLETRGDPAIVVTKAQNDDNPSPQPKDEQLLSLERRPGITPIQSGRREEGLGEEGLG